MMEDGEIVEAVAMDEDLQLLKNGKSAYDLLRDSKTSVEEIVSQIVSIKKDGKDKSQLRELITQTFLHFVTLRQVNRSILLHEDRVKAETERAKTPVDFTTLQLHNLMYEKSHYVKAIKACKDFKSKYPDIQLVPEEEFFRDAPDDIKSSILSSDGSQNLMLKRLNFELHQRKELCKLREKLESQKKSLLETIANRKKFLSSLPSHLKSLKKASLPVQNQLGIQHTKKLKQYSSAELLPPPLYVIFSQLVAQKEAFGEEIDLEIIGSLKDAQNFARQQATKETSASANVETLRVDDDVPEDEDDVQRRRKRPKRAPSKENPDQAGLHQLHPLKLILHIYDDEASDPKSTKLFTLKFEYLLKLHVVCVGVEGSHEEAENNIMCNLFPNDTGAELPHQPAKLTAGSSLAFDEKKTSRPYKWAQHLAGIDFLPEMAPLLSSHENSSSETFKTDAVSGLSLYRQQNRVQTVVQRIRSRKRAQLALVEQLDSLMQLKWPSMNSESIPWALHTPLCSLDSWSSVGPPPNQVCSLHAIPTDQIEEHMDVDNGRSGTSKEGLEGMREDGELPVSSLVQRGSLADDMKLTTSMVSNVERSRQLALISKSIISPLKKVKSQSFKKYDEDSELELLLDIDSDHDELAPTEQERDDMDSIQSPSISWVDFGAKEYSLVLARKLSLEGRNVKLEAKIKISMEYPVRPPLFSLGICPCEGSQDEADGSKWYNELRAIEAEVNLNMLEIVPNDEESYILGHQILCLAMLFDHLMDEEASPSEKPVIGTILARSHRGRDRRRMISWKGV
ncbi:THO complex subunit 5B [Linum grandiflorum]